MLGLGFGDRVKVRCADNGELESNRGYRGYDEAVDLTEE
jgi:hypothetical protein